MKIHHKHPQKTPHRIFYKQFEAKYHFRDLEKHFEDFHPFI